MIPLADAALEGIMAHRRIGQEAFRFDAKAEHQTSLDALAGLDRLAGGGSVRVTGNRGHQRKGNTSSRGRPHWAHAIENDLAPRRLPPRKIPYVLMPLPANGASTVRTAREGKRET
jgi:hypothetical protein